MLGCAGLPSDVAYFSGQALGVQTAPSALRGGGGGGGVHLRIGTLGRLIHRRFDRKDDRHLRKL